MDFGRFFRTPILYNICERLLLVLVRIGLVYRAANLSMFQHRCFPVNIAKFLRRTFIIEHFRWLLVEVLYKKDVLKNFANFTRSHCYRCPFLSTCRLITCNFVKIVSPVGASVRRVFSCEFCEISKINFKQNNFERLLLDVKRCCGQ